MHIAFLSNPASGEVNVQLATAQQLVSQGHCVTFISAESCSKKVDRLRLTQDESNRHLIRFISLGSNRNVNDLCVDSTFVVSNTFSTNIVVSTPSIQDRMHLMRTAPGNPKSLEMHIEAALGPAEEYAATALSVRDHLNTLDPNISELVP